VIVQVDACAVEIRPVPAGAPGALTIAPDTRFATPSKLSALSTTTPVSSDVVVQKEPDSPSETWLETDAYVAPGNPAAASPWR